MQIFERVCGGCFFENNYSKELEWKKNHLSNIFSFDIEIVPCDKREAYRNKAYIPVTINGIGFKKRGSWKKIVPIDGCALFGEKSFEAIKKLKKFMEDFKLAAWDLKKHLGFIRYIVLREGKFTGELMVNIITSNERDLPEEIINYFDADSIYWCVNDKISDISQGYAKKFWKNKFIKERLKDVFYLIGPNSFFQVNPYQTEKILDYISNFLEGKILDTYCGIGTFGIYAAKIGFEVSGFDIKEEATELAKENAIYNKVKANFFVKEDRKMSDFDCDTLIVDLRALDCIKNF